MSTTTHCVNRRQADALLDEWRTFQAPPLTRMLEAAMALVSAADDYRASRIWANDVTRHDHSMTDTIAGLLDHLSDEVGTAQQRLDACGGDPADIDIDRAELDEAHAKLKARSDARRTKEMMEYRAHLAAKARARENLS